MENTRNARGRAALTLSLFALMLAALVMLMVSIGAKKDGFDIDEYWTYGLANSYQQPFLNVPEGRWISGTAFSDYLQVGSHAHEYLNVYENQIADVHPPLYYLLIHALSSVFRAAGFTKWTGIALNIFFFCVTQTALLALSCQLLSKDGRLTPLALLPGLLYGLSAGAASSVVFIRMYAMMTMWGTLLALVLVRLWQAGQSLRRLRALTLILICGFLTQYYFVILACMLCGAYFLGKLVRREFAQAGRFVCWCLFALALAVALFPWCMRHIFGGVRGKEAISSAAGLKLSDFSRWFAILFEILDAQQFGGLLLVLLGVGALLTLIPLGRPRAEMAMPLIALLACGGYVAVIAAISPYKVDRYIFCVYPLVTLALFMLLERGVMRIGAKPWVACLLACAVMAACGGRVNRAQQVHYLFEGDSAYVSACEERADLPCVVLGTNDMTQNILEFAAFDRVCVLEKEDVAGVAQALDTLEDGALEGGFVLFERYPDDAQVETIVRETGMPQAELLFTHQYRVYWVH